MTWQKIKNVSPGLNVVFLIWMRGDPFYAKRFLYQGRDLIAFSIAYSSIASNDPEVLMRNNNPASFEDIKHSNNDYLWQLFVPPE